MIDTIQLHENFITQKQETLILEEMGFATEENKKERNRIRRYGINPGFVNSEYDPVVPECLKQFHFDFDSVTVNEYYPGQGIDWHIDNSVLGPVIRVISLGSPACMDFRCNGSGIPPFRIELPRRSLLVLKDEARDQWQHRVIAEEIRMSLVYRKHK